MNQFIFHIGMHKCASTTLQNKVFRFEPGAIGTHQELDFEFNFGKQFQRLAPVGGRQFGSISGVKEWVERVKKYQSEVDPNVDRFIVSSEFLCQSNKLSNRPIVKFLSDINNKIFDGNSVKIIVVFRNQSEMMASEYAQNSDINYDSSQKDFEKWITKRLNKPGKTTLDWGGWSKSLVDTFGRENVCILLLEEMQEYYFWDKLVSFIEARSLSSEELYEKNKISVKNSNKLNKKTWSLKPFDLSKKAKVDLNKINQLLSGVGLRNIIFEKGPLNLVSVRKKYLKLRGYKDKHLMDDKIRLKPELEIKIRESYKDSNLMLAKILGRDITELGY
jgi:hypothetical protein